MKITGMNQIKKKNRAQSRKSARKFGRKKKDKKEKKNTKKSSIKLFDSSRKREMVILGVSFLVLLLGFYLFTNWRGINDLLNAIEIEDPIIEEVIKSDKINDDGIDRVIVVTTKYSERGDIDIEKIYALSHNREKGVRSIIHLPSEVYIPLSYKEFSEKSSVSSLYYAGETIAKDHGVSYTIWEVGNLLGISFDSYIWLQPEATEMFREETKIAEDEDSDRYLSKLLSISNPINLILQKNDISEMSNYLYSNLDGRTIMNVLSIYNFSGFDEVEYLDLADTKYNEKEIISSGDEVPIIKYAELDPELKELAYATLSKDVEREQAKVEVYNGSTITGQASRYSRDIRNNGIKVVRVDNTDLPYEKTTIFVPKREEFEYSLSLILSFFPNEPVINEQRPEFLTTADIIIVLGDDLEDSIEWLPDL